MKEIFRWVCLVAVVLLSPFTVVSCDDEEGGGTPQIHDLAIDSVSIAPGWEAAPHGMYVPPAKSPTIYEGTRTVVVNSFTKNAGNVADEGEVRHILDMPILSPTIRVESDRKVTGSIPVGGTVYTSTAFKGVRLKAGTGQGMAVVSLITPGVFDDYPENNVKSVEFSVRKPLAKPIGG